MKRASGSMRSPSLSVPSRDYSLSVVAEFDKKHDLFVLNIRFD